MKLRNVFLGVLGIISLNSCENYLDVNDSPNNALYSQIPINLKLSAAQTNTYRTQARGLEQLGKVMMQVWGPNVNGVTGGYIRETTLDIDNSFYSGVWDGLYRTVANYSLIVKDQNAGFEHHKAIANIMLAFHMQQLVDYYGNVPYSEAFQYGVNPTPVYDNDKAIYRQLYAQCDAAIDAINGTPSVAVGAEDVIFGGVMSEWVKMANTVKLRLLIRESTLAETNSESQQYLNEKFAALAGAQFVDSDVSINPGYNNSNDSSQSPFYNLFAFDSAGTAVFNNGFVKASKYAADFLNGASGSVTTVDPRRGRFFTLIGGVVVGVQQGSTTAPASLSDLGPALKTDPSQNGYILTLAESKFMQSEAILRGYLPGGDGAAKNAFTEGIQASMDLSGVAAAAAASYLTATESSPKVGWQGSQEDKIESIMTQKWLSEMQFNAWDSFLDYTRTGYPDVPLAINAMFQQRFKRLLYPTSEAVANSANVPAQSQATAFNSGPFWYVP